MKIYIPRPRPEKNAIILQTTFSSIFLKENFSILIQWIMLTRVESDNKTIFWTNMLTKMPDARVTCSISPTERINFSNVWQPNDYCQTS